MEKEKKTATLKKQTAVQSPCPDSVLTYQETINKSCLEAVCWRISDMRCSDIDPEVEFG